MKSVVLCGSKKYKPEIREFAKKLKKSGVVVYEPHLTSFKWDEIPEDSAKFISIGLTYDHFNKIRRADIIFVYNKDGYVGNSVTLEIGYAAALDKPIYALEKDDDACRNSCFCDIVKTPEELIKKL